MELFLIPIAALIIALLAYDFGKAKGYKLGVGEFTYVQVRAWQYFLESLPEEDRDKVSALVKEYNDKERRKNS